MPHLDRKQKFYQVKLEGTVILEKSVTTGFQAIVAATVRTAWAPDYMSVLDGIKLEIEGMEGTGPGTAGTYVYLTIPLLGVNRLLVATPSGTVIVGSVDFLIILDDPALYSMNGGAWRLKFSAMRVYIDGTLVHSEGATTLDNYYYFAPAGIPIFGIPPSYSPLGAINPPPVIGSIPHSTTVGSSTVRGKCRIEAGWWSRETLASDWVDLPSLIDLASYPSLEDPCPCTPPADAELEADTTGVVIVESEQRLDRSTVLRLPDPTLCDECTNGTAIVPFEYHIHDSYLTFFGRDSFALPIPNLPCGTGRINSDGYKAAVYRGGMPQTQQNASVSCGIDGVGEWGDEGPDQASTSPIYHPRQSSILGVVGNEAHAMEDTFGYGVPSIAYKSSFQYDAHGVVATLVPGPGACPLSPPEEPPGTPNCDYSGDESVCYVQRQTNFGNLIDDILDNPYMMGYLYHLDETARYVNYWASRNWSFVYWFPVNTIDDDGDGDVDSQRQWEKFADKIAVEYFLSVGHQWLYQVDLPLEEQLRTLSTLMTAPLMYGALGNFMATTVFGCQTSWWGDETFRVDHTLPATSVATDSTSASNIFGVNCTLAHGAVIQATPTPGETWLEILVGLGSLNVHPYLYPLLAEDIEVGWNLVNVTSVVVDLVSIDGLTAGVLTNNVEGRFPKPKGSDTVYAGSYAQDFGTGYFEDRGEDLLDTGVSDAIMGDTVRVHEFGMLAGRGAEYLRFHVVFASDASPVFIDYPIFHKSGELAYPFAENRSQSCIVWPAGPGIRFGNVAHFYDDALHATPIIYPPGYPPPFGWKPSAIDWLCFRNLMLLGEPHDDSIVAGIQEFFDSVECPGLNAGDTSTFAPADAFCLATIFPRSSQTWPGAIIVNGSSCPPVCTFPRRSRDTISLEPDTDLPFALHTWSYVENRRFCVGTTPIHMVRGGGGGDVWTGVWLPPGGLPIEDWFITYHQHQVDNSEDYFLVRSGARDIGTRRPWDGLFVVRRHDADTPAREPDVIHIKDGYMFAARVEFDEELETDLLVVKRGHGLPYFGYEVRSVVSAAPPASFPTLAWLPFGRLLCGYTSGGALVYKPSDDDAETWGDEVPLIDPGINGRIASNDDGETLAMAFRYNSGSSGPGKLYRRFQAQSSTTFNAVAAILGAASSVLSFEDDVFGLHWDPAIAAWSLFGKKAGETGPTHFFSTDDGDTWTEID